jgi:hypothetical protein
MNKIELQLVDTHGDDTYHVKVLVNGKDVGILYLNEEEGEIITKLLQRGAAASDAQFNSDLFDQDGDYDDEEE